MKTPSKEYSLPQHYYFSDDIYQQELKKIFCRQWLVVGHISLAKNPGDYFVKQVGPESMIIARDKSGLLHAYFNVCRHRGYRLLPDEDQGTKSIFVCPYHQWGYSNDGRLRNVPGINKEEVNFPFENCSLHEARCEVWHGWVLVYLGEEEPTTLAEVLGPLCDEEKLRAIGSEQLKLAHRENYIIEANWKVMMENNLECYHCLGHPSFIKACDFEEYYRGESSIFVPGEKGAFFPLREGMATFSMDGKRVSAKPLGTPQEDGFSTGFILLPNFSGPAIFVDHAVSLEVTPLAIDRTQLIAEWYVHEDAVEGVDYDVKKLTEVFHNTNREDGHFAEENVKGIQSMRYQPGPITPVRESNLISGYDLYHEMMAAD